MANGGKGRALVFALQEEGAVKLTITKALQS